MSMKNFLKIVLLIGAFWAVVHAMNALDKASQKPSNSDLNSYLGLVLGGDHRILNWCPQDVQKVEVLENTGTVAFTIIDDAIISSFCELMVGGYIKSGIEPAFNLKLKAYGKDSGNPASLERSTEGNLFKFKGMPFSSGGLEKALKRIEGPK